MLGGGIKGFYNIIVDTTVKINNRIKIKDLAVNIKINSLKDKRIAIDANNILYEILTVSHKTNKPKLFKLILSNKINSWNNLGIYHIWVFDNHKVNPLRLEKEFNFQDKIQLTKSNIKQAQEILRDFNIPMIVSKYGLEAEQVCAKLTRNNLTINGTQYNKVDLVMTCDSDALVFGAKGILIRTNKSGIFKQLMLNTILDETDLNRKQLAIVSVLLGTDFNKGTQGVGPIRVIRIVKNNNYYLTNKQKQIIRYYLKD